MNNNLLRLMIIMSVLFTLFVASGCATMSTGGKVLLTPLTVVRDVVDVPVVSVTNVFENWARQSHIARRPGVGIGWSVKGGFDFGIGYDLSYFFFKGLSGLFGAVDYIVCRSIWPNFARGVSPWRHVQQTWGSLYFPNTRVLWGDDAPIFQRPPPEKSEKK